MKKFFIYLIVFISLFVGTATCVVVNGYSKYTKEQEAATSSTITEAENTALTKLASNVLNSEYYSGSITLSDNNNAGTLLNGSFSYINNTELQVQIKLAGVVNNTKIDASVTLIGNYIYIDFNDAKIKLNSSDFLAAVNEVISSINASSGSELSKIDMSALTSLLSNITTTEFGSGYIINANIPNICDIYLKTDSEYIPSQIIASNIRFGQQTYTLNISAEQKESKIVVLAQEYLDATPALEYITPLINTLNLGDLSISGDINLSNATAKIRAYLPKEKNTLLGSIEILGLALNYQITGETIAIDLYGNMYTTSLSDLIKELPDTLNLSNSQKLTLEEILKNTQIAPTINNNIITDCSIAYDTISLDISIGKTFLMPKQINTSNAKDISELFTLIKNLKPIISSKYSADINFKSASIAASGKLFVDIDSSLKNINTLAFEGKINNLNTLLVYNPTTTYINVEDNKIRLQNTTLAQVISTLSELTGGNINDISNTFSLDTSILENITLGHKTVEFKYDDFNAQLIANPSNYTLSVTTQNLAGSLIIVPNSSTYKYISNLVNDTDYKSFDNIPSLISALKNTLNQNVLNYSGEIAISILGHSYKNIGLDLSINQNLGQIEIVLSNLPTDNIVTYLSNLYYKNQTSKITIVNGQVSIHTTVTHKPTNKVLCIADKTLPIQEFSLDNLYEIMSMRKYLIDELKSGNNTEFSTNLTSDCIDVLSSHAKIDLISLAPELFTELRAEFSYSSQIDSAKLIIRIKNYFDIQLTLNKI